MDLNDHLKKLEAFTQKVSKGYAGAAGHDGPWSAQASGLPEWYSRAQLAVEFLERSGAAPEVVEIKDGPKGAPQGLRLRSFDADGLKAHLSGLGSAQGVAAWVEEGVKLGAIAVRGERIFFAVEPQHDRGVLGGGTAAERGVEATGPILEAAQTAMISETAATVELMEKAGANGGGHVVEFRDDLPTSRRQVRAVAEQAQSALEGLKSGSRSAKVIAGAEEIGPRPRFVVTGEAVELADGTYYPVEAVDSATRRAMGRVGATGVKVGAGGRQTLVRAQDTTEVYRPASEAEGMPDADVDGNATADRSSRIQLAYRLLHGMTIDSSQGAPLDAGIASRMETFFGDSLGDVRVHTGRVASEITEALSVEALSMGSHVVIPENLLRSASGEGERVLVHELAHVQQYRRGSEQPRSMRELEADVAVNQFVTGKGVSMLGRAKMPTRAPAPPPETAGTMPRSVYAASPGQVRKASGGGEGKSGSLQSEKSIRRITQEVSRRNRRVLEDLVDRQG